MKTERLKNECDEEIFQTQAWPIYYFRETEIHNNIHRWWNFKTTISSLTDARQRNGRPRRGLLAHGECLDGRLQMYLTALRGVFIIGPPEPRLLRRLNREWEDPPMIGYTGPIRCLRLYRTVILPRYILPARGILISTTPFYFFDHIIRYLDQFAVENSKK